MIKISAAYNNYNPNFVIQNMNEPTEWAHSFFAILKNIFMRGCPTIPSLFLREKMGKTSLGNFKYCFNYEGLNWDSIIKGGQESNPALDFYKNILPDIIPYSKSFIPECPVKEIINNGDCSKEIFGQVDFYSPLYNAVIEIDGLQHKSGEQFSKDKLRDKLLSANGIKLVRISTTELKNKNNIQNKCEKLKYILKTSGYKSENQISESVIPYMLAMRIECLLLYLYGNNKISINDKTIDLNIFADFSVDKQSILYAAVDFFLWLKNLAELQNEEFTAPEIKINIFNDKQEFIKSSGIKADISLTQVYSIPEYEDIYYIRNDYFKYSKEFHKSTSTDYCEPTFPIKKNYFKVCYYPVNYNVSKEKHENNLKFILQNVSVDEYKSFRANQLEIIIEALNNRCVIGVLPTGAGKSLCYQIVSLLVASMTIVIVPLKLLMVDQYEHLRDKLGMNNSTFINSSHTENLDLFANGQSLVTYCAPERFFSEKFAQAIADKKSGLKIGFIVIDESHCLSEWGHDFRTSYLCLSHNLERLLPRETFLMALTGTASHSVFKDIENEFYYFKGKMTKSIFADDMRRSNLKIHVDMFEGNGKDNFKMLEALEQNIFSTIVGSNKLKTLVFTKTKKASIYNKTASACIPLSNYFKHKAEEYSKTDHVGYFAGGDDSSDTDKDKTLSNFKNDTDLTVLFATKAFGMGIDIKDIRKTIHYGLPSSMESLYQQIGRAGRDGERSDCYIYFRKENDDVYKLFFNPKGIKIKDINENKEKLNELETNFYFIQNENMDIKTEEEVTKRILQGIKDRNEYNVDYFECVTICTRLINTVKDDHLKDILLNKKGYSRLTDKDITQHISPNAKTIIEKALYRLYLLGEIEMWNVVYGSDLNNPMFTNLKVTRYTEEEKFNKLVSHIERYETRARAMPEKNDFDGRLKKLLDWTYENYFLERVKSMKTLYDWCYEFTDSNNFMKKIAEYFSNDPVYTRLLEKQLTIQEWIEALRRKPEETKLRIARLLESYENVDALNYISGITRLRLDEYDHFDGEHRLDLCFEGIKAMDSSFKKLLFTETYNCLETEKKKNLFVSKWIEHIPENVYWIYDNTNNEEAEKYIIADFANKLSDIKEKIDVRLQ